MYYDVDEVRMASNDAALCRFVSDVALSLALLSLASGSANLTVRFVGEGCDSGSVGASCCSSAGTVLSVDGVACAASLQDLMRAYVVYDHYGSNDQRFLVSLTSREPPCTPWR